ncbi:hypothetical protein BASA81_008649 [Batrachochytrium salamandrivorans]|nr:hypothetical protein BASA81_008649 [Batrachochytrium salamandrivorans]
MDLRRKKLKRLQQQQAKSNAHSFDPTMLVKESDLIWWVSSSSPGQALLDPDWLKTRLQILPDLANSNAERDILALLTNSPDKSDNALCDELLDVIGYSDYAMELLPEILLHRKQLIKPLKKPKLPSSSFIPGALLGTDPTKRALPTGTTREWCDLKTLAAGPGSAPIVARCEVVNVPAAAPAPLTSQDVLVPISRFGKVSRNAFGGVDSLNRLQSRVFHSAYDTNENLLVVAPTGAGKTLVAMTCIAREIETKSPLGVKCVYIAPMKALAQEVVSKFAERLSGLNMTVRELTGDTQLTRGEMERTQIIVSTPEKWDVISRKGGDLVENVHLLIIDEVHLVGDERGPVVESLVARTIRQVERRQQMVRIVGLSATLPNYQDLALFLRVNPERGLFFFDSSFRPVPLEQRFIGVSLQDTVATLPTTSGTNNPQEEAKKQKTAFKAQKQLDALYNQVAFDHAADCHRRGHQVLIFVHTRKDTSKTARALLEIASTSTGGGNKGKMFSRADSSAYQRIASRVALSRNQDVQSLFPLGMGIHHAGMAREDRSLMEEMFTVGAISILCCTSTLAWGVNLPSHLVIVKGTQIYAPDRGGVCELNSADVFQCFGRAGRPQYDTSGEAVLITEHGQLARYLAMLTHTLPLESKLVQGLPDALNAEIVGGTVSTVDEALAWLSYTFLFVRMLKSPTQYGVPYDARKTDPNLDQARGRLVSQAVRLLSEAKMVRLGVTSASNGLGNAILPGHTPLGVTDLGRVACNYYITYGTVETLFNEKIHRDMSMTELLDAICGSKEFEQLKVREEEMQELRKLSSHACPFALLEVEDVRNPFDTPRAKSFILFQTYITRFPVEAFTLYSDMNYIAQNAARITRALFEVATSKGWLVLALNALQLSAALERQAWWSPMQHPLRQLAPVHVKPETVAVLENGEEDWPVSRLLGMTEPMLTAKFAMLNAHQSDRLLAACKLLPICHVQVSQRQPINSGLLRLVIKLTPQFTWRDKIHGHRQSYHLFVDDGEWIFHSERLSLTDAADAVGLERTLVVPLFQHTVARYFVRVENDSGWLDCGQVATVELGDIQIPKETETYFTELLPLDPLPISALRNPLLQASFQTGLTHFNPVQTQCFHALYHQQHSLIISAPTGSGKTILAELAMWQVLFSPPTQEKAQVVYIAPMKALVSERIADWRTKFQFWNKSVIELTGDSSATQFQLRNADLIVATPEKFEVCTRFYHLDPQHFLHTVHLVVFDEIHLLGEERGASLEAIVSRLKRVQKRPAVRMVGLSATLANPGDVQTWFGDKNAVVYNFRPAVRPVPLEHSSNKPVLVFVASRRQTRLTAIDLISLCAATDQPRRFLHAEDIDYDSIQDEAFRHCAQFGIALHHAGLSKSDRERAELLFASGACQVLVATATLAWGVNLPSHLVVIKGTEYFDAKSRTYSPFPVSDVLQMMGRAGRVQYGEDKGVAVLLVHDQLKAFYKRFLYEPFPLESNLASRFGNLLNVEICSGRVTNLSSALNYLASTFLAVRVGKNPLYYGVESGTEPQAYFTNLVRTRLSGLVEAGCASMDFTPQPLGKVAAKFDLEPETVKWMHDCVIKLSSQSCPKWVLETITQTKDFDELVVRANEEELNRVLAGGLEWGAGRYADLSLPNCKAFLLMQAKMQGVALPIHDYITDSKQVEDLVNRALPAFVAVVCCVQAPFQLCLDAVELMGKLRPSTAAAGSVPMQIQSLMKTGNRIQCTANPSPKTTGGDEGYWWGLITNDGKHTLAMERGKMGELDLPSTYQTTIHLLQVCLVSETSKRKPDYRALSS